MVDVGVGNVQREATRDLLGALAYGQLKAYEQMAADAALAPSLPDRIALAGVAAAELAGFHTLLRHLEAVGEDPLAAMAPIVAPVDAFHERTRPADWPQALVKVHVGDGIARDFYREVAAFLDDPATRAVVTGVLGEVGYAELVVDRVRAAQQADPTLSGRLALWARRLVGEALAQTQTAAVERDALVDLVSSSGDLADLLAVMQRVTEAHSARMAELGLSA